ncbi:hypothetical protein [Pseudomonas putida]|uniref:Uncharacterized protein n=1 Tax=Pseudomonas putida TaxID=303 RepID=A0A8I1ECG3_PSEPU|nr:hypothetical protein [Pseudomonas putida]MBI6882812.1 hypothetical protein [Pseudomonas putida]
MTKPQQIYDEAIWNAKAIKKMAFRKQYDSSEYRSRVDMLRDSWIELANAFELGKLAEVAQLAMDILEPKRSETGQISHHKLSKEDLIHHIQTIPTLQDGLFLNISDDKTLNSIIVSSIRKSNGLRKDSLLRETYDIARSLARVNDIKSWIDLVTSLDNLNEEFELAASTIGLFDLDYIKQHKSEIIRVSPVFDHTPRSFGWGVEGSASKVDSRKLYDALDAIDCKPVILAILKVCWPQYRERFTLQEIMFRYGITPDDEYRKVLSDSAHASSSMGGQYENLAFTYFQYELSIPDPLIPLQKNISPQKLAEVIDFDGCETPYGKAKYLPEKVSALIDECIKLSLKESDWDSVRKTYEESLSRDTLMRSKVYKSNLITAELGI